MSNYKIVEDPTVVPEGVSVSETSKNGDSVIGIIDESTVEMLLLLRVVQFKELMKYNVCNYTVHSTQY